MTHPRVQHALSAEVQPPELDTAPMPATRHVLQCVVAVCCCSVLLQCVVAVCCCSVLLQCDALTPCRNESLTRHPASAPQSEYCVVRAVLRAVA